MFLLVKWEIQKIFVGEFTVCGRYYIELDDKEIAALARLARERAKLLYRDISLEMKTAGEIFPSDVVPVIRDVGAEPMKWGFSMPGKRLLINARSETFTEKASFRGCRRCLVPASGYYEWKSGSDPKQKYRFFRPGEVIYFAALMRTEKVTTAATAAKSAANVPNFPRFVILTRQAVGIAADIHTRMPVMVSPADISAWLSGDYDIDRALCDVQCERADTPPGQIRLDI
jgi:putative SOS response-associated peptidase YedK